MELISLSEMELMEVEGGDWWSSFRDNGITGMCSAIGGTVGAYIDMKSGGNGLAGGLVGGVAGTFVGGAIVASGC